MSEESNVPHGTRRWWFIGAGAVALAALVWLVVANLTGGQPSATPPVASPTDTPGQGTVSVPSPSLPPPTATGTPTVEPTRKPTSVKTGLDNKVETAPGVTARVQRVEVRQG